MEQMISLSSRLDVLLGRKTPKLIQCQVQLCSPAPSVTEHRQAAHITTAPP